MEMWQCAMVVNSAISTMGICLLLGIFTTKDFGKFGSLARLLIIFARLILIILKEYAADVF